MHLRGHTAIQVDSEYSSARLNGKKAMKRPSESFPEKIWSGFSEWYDRYRGVALVVSIPLLLILVVVLIVPRSSPLRFDKPHTLEELRHQGPATLKYAIVIDAGSTGSRVHVFKFEVTNGGLKLISDTFEQLKPGLSSYADEPLKAAESLKPLLETAVKTVPQELQAKTPLSLKATAGLRLLPGTKADNILAAVREFLKKYPFAMDSDAVGIMDGQDEGGYAWLTLNYLLGKVGKGITETVAAIDLGGGSIQEAFALSDADAAAAPKGYINKLKASGQTYNVYVHSYLGYGLMAGRAKLINASQDAEGHPCFPKGHSGTYKYGGNDYPIKTPTAPSDFNKCVAVGAAALELKKDCGAPAEQCSFSGGWRGKAASQGRVYYVSSYFWDRATESGLITDKKALSWPTSPVEFASKGSAVCGKELDQIKASFSEVKPDQAPYFCLDLSFCYTMLTKGFELPETNKINLVKQIEYNGQNIEAAWPLGAAIDDLS